MGQIPPVLPEQTVAAALTALGPDSLPLRGPHEFGVDGRKDRFPLEAPGDFLDPATAGHRHDGVDAVDHRHQFFDIFRIALAFQGMFANFDGACRS